MENKTARIVYLVFMSLVVIALIVFMILHILDGLTTGNDKMILALYVLMMIWGGTRIWTIWRSLKNE